MDKGMNSKLSNLICPHRADSRKSCIKFQGIGITDGGTIEEVKISIDDGNWQLVDGTENWNFIFDSRNIENGYHNFRFQCFNGEQYSKVESIIINIQNDPPNSNPLVSILSHENQDTVKGIVVIAGTSSDSDGDNTIERVEISINQGNWMKVDGRTKWSYQWDTSQVEDGENLISLRSFDGENYSVVSQLFLIVENSEINSIPQIMINNPENNSIVSGIIIITGESFDNDGDNSIESVEVSIDEDNWQVVNGKNSWTFEWDTFETSDGPHTLQFRSFEAV